jgi:tRNA U55 pseudouridine synthase TruB
MARRGQEFILKERTVKIFSIECLDYAWPEAVFEVSVSGGTYIRSLARDIGQQL